MLLECQADIEVLGEAGTGADAVEMFQTLRPDVVVIDVGMPEMSGIEATRRITRISPETAVLVLTMHEDERSFFGMLQAGAMGYIPKRAPAEDLVTAIRTVAAGETFIHPALSGRLVRGYLEQVQSSSDPQTRRGLTSREEEVLVLIAEGLSNPEIGGELRISPKTVDRHCENMMRKLHMKSRIGLVKYAVQQGLATLDDV